MDAIRGQRRGGVWHAAVVAAALAALAGAATADQGGFPQLANIYFPSLGTADLETLSRWDLLVLPKRAQEIHQEELATLRALNPDIVLLVHMPIGYNGAWASPSINAELTDKLDSCDWWLRDTNSGKALINSRDGLIDITPDCTRDANGDRLCDWLPEYIAQHMGPGGYWDGVYLDYCMDRIYWLNRYIPYPIDSNRDGIGDDRAALDEAWREGTGIVVSRLRELVGDDYIVVTNGNNTHYDYCDGGTREAFPKMHGDWYENISNPVYGYLAMETLYRRPSANIINATWSGTATDTSPVWTASCERRFRFTLASTLVFGDGYFSYDGPSHCQVWWHDYYEMDLGRPLGGCAQTWASPGDRWGVEHADMIKTRRFERGLAVINPTSCQQTVSLGGVYYVRASWNGSFYEAEGARTTVTLQMEDGDVLAGSGRMLLEAGGLAAERLDGATLVRWNSVAGAKAYAVYRSYAGADGSGSRAVPVAVVDVPWYWDSSPEVPAAQYVVAGIDGNDCEGQLSRPVEVSSELGSDLSLALMVVCEPDGALALTWNPDEAPSDVLVDLLRMDARGDKVRLNSSPVDPRRVWRWVDDTAEPGLTYVYEAVADFGGFDVTLGRTIWTAWTAPSATEISAQLLGCHPHPMSEGTTIELVIPSSDSPGGRGIRTSLTIYDVAGRAVRHLLDEPLPPGLNAVTWDGTGDAGERVASGCYIYSLNTGGETLKGKLLVVR